MALSMAVLLVPIFVLLVVYRVFFAGDAPIAVDAGETYATAKHSAHFTVEVPQDLPPGWTPRNMAARAGWAGRWISMLCGQVRCWWVTVPRQSPCVVAVRRHLRWTGSMISSWPREPIRAAYWDRSSRQMI